MDQGDVLLRDEITGARLRVRPRPIVNAAGARADSCSRPCGIFRFADAGRTGSLRDLASHCCLAAEGDSVRYLPCLLMLSLHALCLPARAQTLHGLTIGELLIPALKRMPKTKDLSQVGNDVAIKWRLSESVSLSATASPDTGKIVFLEEDWSAASAATDSPLPGLVFGAATLGDIRRRFGSNGIGFASNAETLQDGALVGIKCYELRRAPGIFVAFVTRSTPPGSAGGRASNTIDTGKGVLVSFIVAEKTYLQKIWGDRLLFDPHYKPIIVAGLGAIE